MSVTYMADIKDDADLIDPPTCLISARDDCMEDMPDKLLILKLWDKDGDYKTAFAQSGMKCSEMIALLEIMKRRIITMMNVDTED